MERITSINENTYYTNASYTSGTRGGSYTTGSRGTTGTTSTTGSRGTTTTTASTGTTTTTGSSVTIGSRGSVNTRIININSQFSGPSALTLHYGEVKGVYYKYPTVTTVTTPRTSAGRTTTITNGTNTHRSTAGISRPTTRFNSAIEGTRADYMA